MALEKFHYPITTGQNAKGVDTTYEVVLPKFENVPFGLVRKHRKAEPAEQFFLILEELLTEAQLSQLDKATQKQISQLFEAWQKDSQVTVGES